MVAIALQQRIPGKRRIVFRLAVSLLLFASAGGLIACSREGSAATQAQLQQQAKLSAAAAQTAAVAKVPGSVIGVRLNKERGKVAYDVLVQPQSGGQLQAVHVDAATGQVIKTETAQSNTDEGDDGD